MQYSSAFNSIDPLFKKSLSFFAKYISDTQLICWYQRRQAIFIRYCGFFPFYVRLFHTRCSLIYHNCYAILFGAWIKIIFHAFACLLSLHIITSSAAASIHSFETFFLDLPSYALTCQVVSYFHVLSAMLELLLPE